MWWCLLVLVVSVDPGEGEADGDNEHRASQPRHVSCIERKEDKKVSVQWFDVREGLKFD